MRERYDGNLGVVLWTWGILGVLTAICILCGL